MSWTGACAARVLAAALIAAVVSGPVLAGDDDTFDADLQRCRKRIEMRNWNSARKGLDDLFARHEGDPRVFEHLREIEDATKLCAFQRSRPEMDPRDVFGKGVHKYSERTRDIEMRTASTAAAYGWSTDGETSVYPVVLEGSVEVTFDYSGVCETSGLLCWDPEKDGGYLVNVGFMKTSSVDILSVARVIIRIDEDGDKTLFRKEHGSDTPRRGTVTYARKGSTITAKLGKKGVAKASDGRYKQGYVGLLGGSPGDIVIRGRVEEDAAARAIGEWESRAFREWEATRWDRTRWLPEWVLQGPTPAGKTSRPVALPSEVPDGQREAVETALRALHGGDDLGFIVFAQLIELPKGLTRRYLEALSSLVEHDFASARSGLEAVAEQAPEFAPARVFLARALLRIGRFEDARKLLDGAAPSVSDFAPLYVERVWLEFAEGDFDAAAEVLGDASRNGAVSEGLTALRDWVHLARRGPQWPQRHKHETRHFRVASDLSREICQEVGRMLETSLTAYSVHFKRLQRRNKARVYVFSGSQGYLAYAAEMGMDLADTAGAYSPFLRELVIWTHDDPREMWNTVRHEAFHQYLHNFLDDAPIWFDEGYAEYFGFAEYKSGKLDLGSFDEAQTAVMQKARFHFVPLKKLFLMPREEFMAKADAFYPQSWAVVHMLRHTERSEHRRLLDEYFEALLDGSSQATAYEAVLAPRIETLQKDFDNHVWTLLRK